MRHSISYIIPAVLIVAIHYSVNNNPLWQFVLIGLSTSLIVAAAVNGSRLVNRSVFISATLFLMLLFFYMFNSIYLVASVFTANGFTEQAIAHLNMQSFESGGNKELVPYHYAVAAIAFVIIIALFFAKRFTSNSIAKPKAANVVLLAIFALLIHPGSTDLATHWWYSVKRGNIDRSLQATLEGSHINKRLIDNAIDQRRGVVKKSIVLIYLESFERAYLDQKLFPNLSSKLAALESQESTYGSFMPTFFASHTIAGLVSSLCSVPYATTGGTSGNSMNSGSGDYYMPHVQCLGDITKELGYYNVYYQGGGLGFTRKGAFFNAHGYHEIKGGNELWKDMPRKHRSNWGLHDDKLFDFAQQRISQLANDSVKRPFLFTLLTLDTHDPFGSNKTSLSCNQSDKHIYPGPQGHVIKNQIYCSDSLIGEFVQTLREKYSDTLDIYLVADHLAHAHSQGKTLKSVKRRELIFIGLNGEEPHKGERQFTHLDIAPTILDHATDGFLRKMGLGVSLLRSEKTLLEQFGLDAFEQTIRDNLAALAERYWDYPSLIGSPFSVDTESSEFRFAGTSFPSPVLFRLNQHTQIQSYHSTSISEYLKASKEVERVLTVQKCGALRRYQPHSFAASSLCLMIGNLGSENLHIELIEPGKEYSIETYFNFLDLEANKARLRSRLFENTTSQSKIVSSASSRNIKPLADVHFVTGAESTSRMVTNYWNLYRFEKFRNFKNHGAAKSDGLYLFKIDSGRVDLLNSWTSCEELKRDKLKAFIQNANADEFVLMSGRNGFECSDHISDTPFDSHISMYTKGQSLIAYLDQKTNFYKPILNTRGENIQLNLVDETIYSHYLD